MRGGWEERREKERERERERERDRERERRGGEKIEREARERETGGIP